MEILPIAPLQLLDENSIRHPHMFSRERTTPLQSSVKNKYPIDAHAVKNRFSWCLSAVTSLV